MNNPLIELLKCPSVKLGRQVEVFFLPNNYSAILLPQECGGHRWLTVKLGEDFDSFRERMLELSQLIAEADTEYNRRLGLHDDTGASSWRQQREEYENTAVETLREHGFILPGEV